MPAPAYVLSEYLSLRDVFSNIEVACAEVAKNTVQRATIVAVMKQYILKTRTFAKGAFRKYYMLPVSLPVASGVVDLTGHGVVDVRGVLDTDIASAADGDDGVYTPAQTWEEWGRLRKNAHYDGYARIYYPTLGQKKILLYEGAEIVAPNSVDVLIERTPYVGFTIVDVDAGTEMIDVHDILTPFVEAGSALQCLRISGVKQGLGNLEENWNEIVSGLNSMIIGDDQRLKQTIQDQ